MLRSRSMGAWVVALCALVWAGCGDTGSEEVGEVHLSAAANEAVRVGFPHTEEGLGELAFVDGWSVTIDTFAMSLKRVELLEPTNDGKGPVATSWAEAALVDIASEDDGDVEFAVMTEVTEGRYDFSFEVSPPDASTTITGVSTDVATMMIDNGWSLYIVATATPEPENTEFSEPVTLEIGLDLNATYFDCINGADGTKGLVVAGNRVAEAYIYPHVVHLFWDTLGSGDEQLRLNAMARVAGDDNTVRMEDLYTVDLTSPELADGNGIPMYDDSGLLDEYNLGAFVKRAMYESIHFNGVGFCKKTIHE